MPPPTGVRPAETGTTTGGIFPFCGAHLARLLHEGFSADEIRASNLLADSRLPGRLVGPIRDADGRIVSFWGRLPAQLDRTLYLSSDWKEQVGVFGLDAAHRAVAQDRLGLLLVEDLWDAILLQARGYLSVGAIGNSPAEIIPQRWERLDELGIHRVTLVVDSFHDSHEAAVAAIRQASFSRRSPAIYVLPPAAVHGAWQSWEQGRAATPETLEKLLSAHRIHGFHYLALSLIAMHKGDGPWTEAARRTALSEARDFYATVHQRNVPQLDAFFLPPLLEALGLGWGDRSAWHDHWLEDVPSSNGSALADPDSAAHPPQAEEPSTHTPSEPEPAKQEEAAGDLSVQEEIVLEPAIVATPHTGHPGSSDYCDFHQCDRIVCLCWD